MPRGPTTASVAFVVISLVSTYAKDCPGSEAPRLGEILTGPTMRTCQNATGASWNPFDSSATPMPLQPVDLCKIDACQQVFRGLVELKPKDCEIAPALNIKKLVDDYAVDCGWHDPAPTSQKSLRVPVTSNNDSASGKLQEYSGAAVAKSSQALWWIAACFILRIGFDAEFDM